MRVRVCLVVVLFLVASSPAAGAQFVRGDADQNGVLNVTDVVVILGYLFWGAETSCLGALDVNDSGTVDIADAIRLVRYIFGEASPPAAPFPECGYAPSGSALSCAAFALPACNPPPCLTGLDLADDLAMEIGVPLCLPSPLAQWDFLGSAIVVCPEGSACSGGQSGCEVVFQEVALDVDLAAGRVAAVFTLTAALPVLLGTTQCGADFTLECTLGLDLVLEDTQWRGVREIVRTGELVFEITSLDVETSGGFLCGAIGLSIGVFRKLLQEQLNALFAGLPGLGELDLGGIYVCVED